MWLLCGSNTEPRGNREDSCRLLTTHTEVQEHGPGQVRGASQDGSDLNTLISPQFVTSSWTQPERRSEDQTRSSASQKVLNLKRGQLSQPSEQLS